MTDVLEKANVKIIPLEVPASNVLKTINFYLVQKTDFLYLIDAGLDKDTYWEYLQHALQSLEKKVSDLTAVLLTHHHFDHVGLASRIAEYDIPIYIHPYGLPIMKRDPKYIYSNYLLFKDTLAKLNTGEFGQEQIEEAYKRQMKKEETALGWDIRPIEMDTIFDFQVIEIPGHAFDQVGFYLADEKMMFVGDLLIDHLRSNAFVEPDLEGKKTPALKQHVNSLKKLVELNPEVAFSGHGKVIQEPAKLATRRLNAIESKAKSFLTMIEEGISTGAEIVKRRHPNKYKELFLTLMSDSLSFLDYLEAEGKVLKEEKEGIWHWKINDN